jgi:hypothetical protein
MSNWLRGCSPSAGNDPGDCVLSRSAWSLGGIHFAITAKDGVDDNATSLFDLEEFVERVVSLSGACLDARCAEVIIYQRS